MRVIANSLPKSGTHVLTRFLELSGFKCSDVHFSASLVRLTQRNPVQRFLTKRRRWKENDTGGYLEVDIDDPSGKIKDKSFYYELNRIPQQTYSEGHLPYSDKLASAFYENNYRVLFIIRDPRDVMLSYVNHMLREKDHPYHKLFMNQQGDDERINIVLDGYDGISGFLLAPMRYRLQRVIQWVDAPNICAVRFEDIIGPSGKGDRELQHKTTKTILDFLGLDSGASNIKNIADKLFHKDSSTFHKGAIGEWQNIFSDSIKEKCKKELGDFLVRLDYEKNNDW